MRAVLTLLVALNIGYFVWQRQASPATSIEVAPVSVYRPDSQRLTMLIEASGSDRGASVGGVTLRGERCRLLGEFATASAASSMVQRLLARNIPAELYPLEVEGGTDYWLYLMPTSSRQAATRQLRELQSRNIDGHIITTGDLANGISLGIFSREEIAERGRARLRNAGYAPEVRQLPRARRQMWVRIEQRSVALLDENLSRYLGGLASLQDREVDCTSIAVNGQFP
ncbi:SPOR domain-containing protein [Stutzerimonas tarimensis]|uniref:SPOR domain-containing protein n=1 Tax=Stutzerimonas tarimensis TaxID=1507735 RepID=A0ABV7T2D2_9GAMM